MDGLTEASIVTAVRADYSPVSDLWASSAVSRLYVGIAMARLGGERGIGKP
jgi:hypothetical protein